MYSNISKMIVFIVHKLYDVCCYLIISVCVNFFLGLKGTKKTLVLREIPEDGVKKLLSVKESLAACDIALFVHDR